VPFLSTRERDVNGASDRGRDIRTFRRDDRIRENVASLDEHEEGQRGRVLARATRLVYAIHIHARNMQRQHSATRGIRERLAGLHHDGELHDANAKM